MMPLQYLACGWTFHDSTMGRNIQYYKVCGYVGQLHQWSQLQAFKFSKDKAQFGVRSQSGLLWKA